MSYLSINIITNPSHAFPFKKTLIKKTEHNVDRNRVNVVNNVPKQLLKNLTSRFYFAKNKTVKLLYRGSDL